MYDWNPLRICKIDNSNNELLVVDEKKTPPIFSMARGSSNGFKYLKKIENHNSGNISMNILEEEIWVVNHLVSYEQPRHYYHMISVFDKDMNLQRYSAPFKFEGEPIEYCLSIVVEHEKVIINYSTWDRTTNIAIYDKKYIDSIVIYDEK